MDKNDLPLMEHVVDNIVQLHEADPDFLSPEIAMAFQAIYHSDPLVILEDVAANNVDLEQLLAGKVSEAYKMVVDDEVRSQVRTLVTHPEMMRRMLLGKRLSPKSRSAYTAAGLDHLIKELDLIDAFHFREYMVDATRNVLQLYGFVDIDSFWTGTTRANETVRLDYSDIIRPIDLPFEDFCFRVHFVRGLEHFNLTLHHAKENVKLGIYTARTLLSRSLITDLPVMPMEQAKNLYKNKGRDPLTLAFHDGFVVKTEDILGSCYAYHPINLAEALTAFMDKRKHQHFFMKVRGLDPKYVPRPDYSQQMYDAMSLHYQLRSGKKGVNITPTENVVLDFTSGTVEVDLSPFHSILQTENSKRLRDIHSLGNITFFLPGYGTQSRHQHQAGVSHITRSLCSAFGLKGYDLLLPITYGLVHDFGHLTGCHATEQFFRSFDHEHFAIELIRKESEAFSKVVEVDDLVAMFEGKNPLHTLVDGPFGSDRMYYLCIDPNEFGKEKTYDSLSLMKWLRYIDGQVVVDQYIEAAFEFLDFRAQMYEDVYYSPRTQIADSYQKKMLTLSGITDFRDELTFTNNGHTGLVPEQGMKKPFWQCTDTLFHYYMTNHPNEDVREIARHLVSVFFRAPHSTVAVVKLPGYSDWEVEIPVYSKLFYGHIDPVTEHAPKEELSLFHGLWKRTNFQRALEHRIATLWEDELHIPAALSERHIIVASVPSMEKLAHEYAPVRIGGEVKSLFEWDPKYQKPFLERANRMMCLRVAVHPQMYPMAFEYFLDNSFLEIAKDVAKGYEK